MATLTVTETAELAKRIEGTKIVVEARHIEAGVRGEGAECPIALATCTVLGDDHLYEVTQEHIEFDAGFFALPESAQRFVYDFDLGAEVEPFEFVIGGDIT